MPAASLDPIIHQQTRLQILSALYRNGRASFTDLRDGLQLTPGNLASHASRLEESGYVRSGRTLRSTGFEAQFLLTIEGARAFEDYLDQLRLLLQTAGQDPGLPGKQ